MDKNCIAKNNERKLLIQAIKIKKRSYG